MNIIQLLKPKTYTLRLHKIDKNFDNCVTTVPKIDIEFLEITDINYKKIAEIRNNKEINKFKSYLRSGSKGLCVCSDNKIIGYGWAKFSGSKDVFYKIKPESVYLSTFFVSPVFRGNNIYPALIRALVEKFGSDRDCYIAAQPENSSSLRGMKKALAFFIRDDKFVHFPGCTLNKKYI